MESAISAPSDNTSAKAVLTISSEKIPIPRDARAVEDSSSIVSSATSDSSFSTSVNRSSHGIARIRFSKSSSKNGFPMKSFIPDCIARSISASANVAETPIIQG